jgi:nicotinamidase-related amidase
MSPQEHAPIDPTHAALVVMDYQNGIVPMIDNSDELLSTAANVISSFREHGGTIGYVRVGFADGDLDNAPATSGMAANVPPERAAIMHADGPATQIHDSIAPEPGDIVVRKQRVGAFSSRPVASTRSSWPVSAPAAASTRPCSTRSIATIA